MSQSSLDALLAQEQALQLPWFNHELAWQLGSRLRELALQQGAAVAMEVYGFGQVLFASALAGTAKANQDWVWRKRNGVLLHGHSSQYLALYNRSKGRVYETQPHVDASQYCAAGGSFPLVIRGSGLVGAVTVSGLTDEGDHQLVTEALAQVLEQLAGA